MVDFCRSMFPPPQLEEQMQADSEMFQVEVPNPYHEENQENCEDLIL
jgi:hypothetical protein